MTNICPDIVLTGRYNSKEAAALLGIHRNTLRDWTRRRYIESTIGRNGRPYFTGRAIRDAWRNGF